MTFEFRAIHGLASRNARRPLAAQDANNGSRARRFAFAMLELVIVMLILAILAAVAAPRYFDSLARFRVDAAAKRIAADLARARRTAKTSGATTTVRFTVSSNVYDLTGVDDIDHPGRPYVVDLSQTGYPATLTSANFGAGGSVVMFDMYGKPDNGGTVVVSSAGHQRTVSVDAATGKCGVQ